MARNLTTEQALAIRNQTSLFDEKIFESNKIARAEPNIQGKWTRNAMKILISDINPEDDDFRRVSIPLAKLVGGWQNLHGETYQIGKEEIKKMVSDRICVEIIKGVRAVAFTIFDGCVEYDDRKKELSCRLNPLLRPWYIRLHEQMTVLQLGEYLRLSKPFYKDLYEWLRAYQSNKDYTFEITVENFCQHFQCPAFAKSHRAHLLERIGNAWSEISSLTDLVFFFEGIYAPTTSTKQKGKLLKIKFEVKHQTVNRLSDIPEYKRKKAE